MATSDEPRILALDAMGSDKGPAELVAGLRLAFDHGVPLQKAYVVGLDEEILPALRAHGLEDDARVSVFPATQVISMEDKPVQSLKRKKDSSMMRAVELVKKGTCQAAVSCGNTGALMAAGTLKLGTLKGVERPALATPIPTRDGLFILLDVGANPNAKPEHLAINAILGAEYARCALGVSEPKVGLLSIGTEESKGNETTLAAHALLKVLGEGQVIRYTGPVEGFQLFEESVDVVVCDGFVGNVLIKTCEALVRFFGRSLKSELKKNPVRMAGALLTKGAFAAVKDTLDPDRYGGAPLLGIRGTVVKSHGSSDREAIRHAIRIASEVIAHRLTDSTLALVERANEILPARGGARAAEKPSTAPTG